MTKISPLTISIALLAAITISPPGHTSQAPAMDPDEARDIAIEAYIYAYPLVIMEITRRAQANAAAAGGKELTNRFSHRSTFPGAKFTDVVRPNADTLYSQLYYDVSREPLVISVPDSGSRYYLLPTLDMWTDVFSSTGSRTTGNAAQTYALVAPQWRGQLPAGMEAIRSPTNMGWMIGRTQTNGPSDYANVHKFQQGLTAVPLSRRGKPAEPEMAKVNSSQWDSKTPPVEQVAKLDASSFFSLFGELTKANPPHVNDYPILQRMHRIGLEPGKSFSLEKLPPALRTPVSEALPAAQKLIMNAFRGSGVMSNGWRTNMTAIGTYGADYLHRAGIAYAGLGANTIEDAIYPTALVDADARPLDSDSRYVLHFNRDQIPPVRAFWSLTMYNDRQFFADNPIDRYAIGDRDKLALNADGSLDIYIQRDNPGPEREANWLPAPASGPFTMNLRLYWPKPAALHGQWAPPPVKRIE